MGQAKQRGSFEERVKQANPLGHNNDTVNLLKHFNLPADSNVKGYAILLPEKERFVAKIEKTENDVLFAYTDTPEYAHLYAKPQQALAASLPLSEEKMIVCMVIKESPFLFKIKEIYANYQT